MVRGKVQMRRIENAINRQVTFSKRRNGLIKKANELSILCDAQVALIVFSQSGRLFEFSSHSDMQKILERYHQYIVKDDPITNNNNKVGEDFMQMQQLIKLDPSSMAKKIELLELYHRNLLGHNYLNSCSYYELQGIENQLVTSLQNIRLRKAQLYMDHIEQLQNKERNMLLENVKLSEMYGPKSSQRAWDNNKHREAIAEAFPSSPSIQSSHVETELFIGLPQWRCSYI